MLVSTCELLQCPACNGGTLIPIGALGESIDEGSLRCRQCGRDYAVREGIPIFLDELLTTSSVETRFGDLDGISQQKIRQREWHDRAFIEQDFEYVKFNYNSSAFYAYLLYYELREVYELLSSRRYAHIANLCSGQGFEIEFLSQLSQSILILDISRNSLRKARLKGEALGIKVEAVCCDAENLPLRDNIVDFALTYHGFHHLARPVRGLEEMARISRYRLALFEPAKGIVRKLVKKLGLKPETEESGNLVYEFGLNEIREFATQQNLNVKYLRKYLITHPATEPSLFRRMDASGITPLLCTLISIANRRFGNLLGTKCAVVLEKEGQDGRNAPNRTEKCPTESALV